MEEACDYVQVSTTIDGGDKACELALKIVESRLAACVQRMPIASTYRWQGKIEQADEVLLLAKTTRGLASQLVEMVKSVHPYEVPENPEVRVDTTDITPDEAAREVLLYLGHKGFI